MRYYVGVDGGATKTHLVLTDGQGNPVAEGGAGASNYQIVGPVQARRNVAQALASALDAAGLRAGDVARVVGGFAGLDGPADAVVAWAGALEAQPGTLVISGTGAIALAVNAAGQSALADGWGHWVGDEGSGFDIGRRGIQAVVRAVDGRGQDTELVAGLQAYCRDLGLDDWRHWITWLNSHSQEAHGQIAAFAPVVGELASAGDPVALAILQDAGRRLALTAWSAMRRVGLDVAEQAPVATVGSALARSPVLRACFERSLQEHCPRCQVRWPSLQPAEGAAILARRPELIPLGVLRVTGTGTQKSVAGGHRSLAAGRSSNT